MKLELGAVPKETINRWPVHETGLPARLVHAAERYDIPNLGALRAIPERELLAMRNVGRLSLVQLRAFLARCDALSSGRLRFANLPEVFASFLSTDEWEILQTRYGLKSFLGMPSRRAATLDSIGCATQRTRERIRQVADQALEKCRSRWARVCLEPLARRFEKTLESEDGFATCEAWRKHWPPAQLDGLDACGLLLLMADTQPERFCYHRLLFFQCGQVELARAEQELLAHLTAHPEPVPAADLAARIPWPPRVATRSLSLLATALPDVGATRDGRFFLLSKGLKHVLRELFQTLGSDRAPLATVAAGLNEHLLPANHRTERGWQAVARQQPGITIDAAGLVRIRDRG